MAERWCTKKNIDWNKLVGKSVKIEASDSLLIAILPDKSSITLGYETKKAIARFPYAKSSTPLTHAELQRIITSLEANRFCVRDRLFIELSIRTGMRLSEMLRIRICDVWSNGSVIMRFRGIPAIEQLVSLWVHELTRRPQFSQDSPLFCSRVRDSNGHFRAIARETAWRILRDAVLKAGITRRITTESLRKTFAARRFSDTGKLGDLQQVLRHKSFSSTVQYLAFRPEFSPEKRLANHG